MTASSGGSRRWAAVFLLGTAAAAEGWLGYRVLQAPDTVLELLPVHAGTALATGAGAAMLYRCGERSPLILLFVVSLAFIGPVGVVGSAVTVLFRRILARRATPFAQWYGALFPPEETNPTRALYEHVVLRGGGPGKRSTVAPFADVMALGTVQEKQSVIGLIAENFQPAFAEALGAALNDMEPAVRVQAAGVVAHIENRFLQRTVVLEVRSAASPDDPALLLDLARLYDEQVATCLLDEGRGRETAMRTLDLYLRATELSRGPVASDVTEAVGRLLLRLDRPQEAFEMLHAAIRRPDSSAGTIGRYLECLYRLGRFRDLRIACRRLCRQARHAALPEEIRGVASLWAEGVGAAGA